VTTLTDPALWTKDEIVNLYGERWNVEVDLRSIKTHMRMDVLTCQTPERVRKEIWAHLLAYNLVREVMARAAREHGVTPRRLSFLGAVQTLFLYSVQCSVFSVQQIRRVMCAVPGFGFH
jgi:Transposase DDE domain